MSTNTTDTTLEDRRQAALAELHQHQDRKRREREASAEARIERAVQATRAEQEHEEEQRRTSAQLARFMEEHRAKVEAASREHQAQQKAGIRPAGSTRPPEYEVAKFLRARLGDEAVTIVAKLRNLNLRQLAIELDKLPADERAEALNRERAVLAARLAEEAKTLPVPQDEAEAEILAKFGFISPVRAAELDAGAL